MTTTDLRYPVGKHTRTKDATEQEIKGWIHTIADFPSQLALAVQDIQEEELSWHYRPDGWTVRQVVHHCADSHANAFIRFKLTLSEEKPTIKPYHEDIWAKLPDSSMPIEPSLQIIKGIHARWAYLMENMQESDWTRVFVHPEHGREVSLKDGLALYAWHCRHHLAHIYQAKEHKFSA